MDQDEAPLPDVSPWPPSLKFIVAPGENPPPQELQVFDPRPGRVTAGGSADVDWVEVRPTQFSGILDVYVDTSGLPEGEYSTRIRILDSSGYPSATVPVTLIVTQNVRIETGVIDVICSKFVPRQLMLYFEEGTSQDEMLEVIGGLGAEVLEMMPGSTSFVLVRTPIGVSIREAEEYFESDPRIALTCRNWIGSIISGIKLYTASGTINLFGDLSYIMSFEREWIVEVRGPSSWATGTMDVYSITKLRLNELTKHGSLHFAGPSSQYLLLIEDGGDVWELQGVMAEELLSLPGTHGAGITVTGLDKGLSRDAHSGGMQFLLLSYVFD